MEDEKAKGAGGGKGDLSKQAGRKPPVPPRLESTRTGPAGPYGRRPVPVYFVAKPGVETPNQKLWEYIQDVSSALSFKNYSLFLDSVLSDAPGASGELRSALTSSLRPQPFPSFARSTATVIASTRPPPCPSLQPQGATAIQPPRLKPSGGQTQTDNRPRTAAQSAL